MTEPQTMGGYLRAARRKRRVSLERAAEDTKIRGDYLMRMESDEFDFLAPAYVRGFLKTYARYLRVEPDPLIHEFERRYGAARVNTAQALAEGRRRNAPREPRRINSWVMAGAAALVVLVSLGLIGLAQDKGGDRRAAEVTPTATAEETATPTESPTPEDAATPDEEPTEDVVAFADGIEVVIDVVRSDCWVDVTADGVKLWSDTIPVGESQTFTAEEGMTIILGFPAGIELTVNGQDFGAPGGPDPITIKLPDDIDNL